MTWCPAFASRSVRPKPSSPVPPIDRDVHGATLAEDGCGPAGFAGGAAGKIGLEAAGYFLPTFVATTATL